MTWTVVAWFALSAVISALILMIIWALFGLWLSDRGRWLGDD